eukprot:snap_masked-scaffold_69-processed-gene-0.26-mRNA-1 protein AED:1.00 eAED:1.00 QI:0/-1/0/0/-1/1/1/0/233
MKRKEETKKKHDSLRQLLLKWEKEREEMNWCCELCEKGQVQPCLTSKCDFCSHERDPSWSFQNGTPIHRGSVLKKQNESKDILIIRHRDRKKKIFIAWEFYCLRKMTYLHQQEISTDNLADYELSLCLDINLGEDYEVCLRCNNLTRKFNSGVKEDPEMLKFWIREKIRSHRAKENVHKTNKMLLKNKRLTGVEYRAFVADMTKSRKELLQLKKEFYFCKHVKECAFCSQPFD